MFEENFRKIYNKLYKNNESFIEIIEKIINRLDTKNQKYIHNKKYIPQGII